MYILINSATVCYLNTIMPFLSRKDFLHVIYFKAGSFKISGSPLYGKASGRETFPVCRHGIRQKFRHVDINILSPACDARKNLYRT